MGFYLIIIIIFVPKKQKEMADYLDELNNGGFAGGGTTGGSAPFGEAPGDSGGAPSGSSGAPSGETPGGSGGAPSAGAPPAGDSVLGDSTTYETAEAYVASLNSDTAWISYDSSTNTASVMRTTQIGRARVGKECRSRWSPYH